MTKKTNKARYAAPAAAAPPPRAVSSDSENSDTEDRAPSRTSTSSVEEEQVKETNGHRPYAQKETSTTGFLSRVGSLPLIHDGVATFQTYANNNKYSKYALDTAGSAVGSVSKYTEGYQNLLQPHISKVDKLANRSLDLIETTFPIVTKPTAEIVTTVKKPYVYVEESSKSAYNQIQTTIDTRVTVPVKNVAASTRNQITTVATNTRNQITTAATSTATTISTAATSTATTISTAATSTATSIATKVNTHATPLVDGLETAVNKILPATNEGENTPQQSNQATRVVDIGRTVSLRVTRRVSNQVAPYREAAEKNTVVVKSKDSIHALNARLTALSETLRVHAKELQENVQKAPGEASARVQTRVSALSQKVIQEIDSLSVYLKTHSPALPEYVQVRIQPLVNFVNDRYVVVKGELSKKDVGAIQKARNILHLTTEETLPILQNAANDIRASLTQYQVSIQENLHQGYVKVQEVHSSVNLAAARAVHSVRVIFVGSK